MTSGLFRPTMADVTALLASPELAPSLSENSAFFVAATYPVRLS